MNTKELLVEWKKFLNEEVKPDIYFAEKGIDLGDLLGKYKIDHRDHKEYKNVNGEIISAPYEKAHFEPDSKMKKMVVGIEFTSKVAIHEQTYDKGEIYILKDYSPSQRPDMEHLVPISFYSSDIHRSPEKK